MQRIDAYLDEKLGGAWAPRSKGEGKGGKEPSAEKKN